MGVAYIGRQRKKKDKSDKRPVKFKNIQISTDTHERLVELLRQTRKAGEYYPHNHIEIYDLLITALIEEATSGSKLQRAIFDLKKLKSMMTTGKRGNMEIFDSLADRIHLCACQVEKSFRRHYPAAEAKPKMRRGND